MLSEKILNFLWLIAAKMKNHFTTTYIDSISKNSFCLFLQLNQ